MLRLALVALVPSVVVATSQGVRTSCDAWGNFGCNKWFVDTFDGTVDRLRCLESETTVGPMPWAMKPDRSPFFTVRAGDGTTSADLTDYVPGEYINIYIRTLKYGYEWRGLLIHAVNGSGASVGQWVNPTDVEGSLYWTPPQCPRAAMHVSAELKPYVLKLTFQAPPKGHGPLTFRTLLKRGVANHGWFHRPAVDLVLQEGAVATPTWVPANVGETCSATCQRLGRDSVDTASMQPPQGYDVASWGFAVQRNELCSQPLVSTCASAAPLSTNGFCFYPDNNCAAWRPTDGSVLNSATKHNLCACSGATGPIRCPPGETLVNGQCVVVCPAGSTLVNGQCVVNCPTGATLVNGQCVCPTNQAVVNNQCVACATGASVVNGVCTCPTGTTLVNGQCAANCPAGTTLVNGQCTCPTGQVLVNGQCVTCPTGTTVVNGQCTCPSGTTLVNGQCVSCPAGTTLVDGVCTCPTGQALVNGQCVTCPAGSTLVNGQCVCPTGQILVNGQCIVTCPQGASLVNGKCTVSPATSTKASLSLVSFLAAAVFATSSKRSNLVLVGLLAMALVMPTASAHNWLMTPGRASFQASTVSPCQGRKASDVHAQVSRTQDIVFKWAVGHDRDTYWVILSGKDEGWLGHPDFEVMIEDYITNAPTNEAFTAGKMRQHGVARSTTDFSMYDGNSGPGAQYSAKILTTDAAYLSHPRSPGNVQYAYKQSVIVRDKRVSYVSAKYPWIEAVFRYEHTYPLANDYDVISLTIPGRSGDGHYIVHWRWSGYYDCVDVDVRSAAVPERYGTISPGYIYSRIDHCRYEDYKRVLSHCIEATVTAQPCVDELPDRMEEYRIGINIQPLKLPDTVYKDFRALNNIPWNDPTCASTSFTILSGEVTETPINWNNWKKVFTPGTACTNVERDDMIIDLKRAVAYCIGMPNCVGLQWKKAATNDTGIPTTGTRIFSFCLGTATTANTQYSTAFPGTLTTYTDGTPGTPITISFGGPPEVVSKISLAANTFVDKGDPYGPRAGGQTFGWNCAVDIDCCTDDEAHPTIDNSFYVYYKDCAGQPGKPQVWEMAVENGVYTVESWHDHYEADEPEIDVAGCNVEGVQLQLHGVVKSPRGTRLTRTNIEVVDGRITLDANKGCFALNWMKFTRVRGLGLNEIWLPAVSNPTYQISLGKTEKVGVIRVSNMKYYVDGEYSCPAWWFFRGATCPDAHVMGWFNDTSNQGIKVGVSSTPCTSSGCGGTTCGVINHATDFEVDNFIDCQGAEGSYVWVWAPGAARIFVGEVLANRYAPVVDDNPLICYGVEAREQTQTLPEYVTTFDPENPLFYSSCITREPAITWLDIPPPPPPPARWRFNGHCLNCSTFYNNMYTDPMQLPGPWEFSDGHCMHCTIDVPPPAPVVKWNRHAKGACDDRDTYHKTCAAGTSCLKRLYARGRRPEDYRRWGWQVSFEECKVLVARDPECGDEMIWANRSWSVDADVRSLECSCYKKAACCGKCTPVANDNDGWVFTREPNSVPDPTCATGIKDSATAAKVCCPSHCKDSSGNPTCGALGDCRNGPVGGGSCCEPNIVGSCSVMGPPCRL